MEIYFFGVIVAFILYRIGRYLEFKNNEASVIGESSWTTIIIFYVCIACSWIGVVLLSVIVIMILLELNKDKKPPKWL